MNTLKYTFATMFLLRCAGKQTNQVAACCSAVKIGKMYYNDDVND